MPKFNIKEKVTYKGRKAIIADHLKGKYLLWDHTGENELKINGEDLEWIPQDQITKGWDEDHLQNLQEKYDKLPSLIGVDGNAFAVMGHFRKHARRAEWDSEDIDFVLDKAKSGDYDHLLTTISTFTD